jgi:hypothetical protein
MNICIYINNIIKFLFLSTNNKNGKNDKNCKNTSKILLFFINYKKQQRCIICLSKNRKNLIKTKCNHYYHKECIIKWCEISNTCPACRFINPIIILI